MKKVIIIGAGISGLSAGIFGRKCGFDTEIYEMHSIPGGECTGWNRKGYHFDNCIHWLTGTNKEADLYKVWEAVGALRNIEIYQFEYLFSVRVNNKTIYFFRDINKFKEHLLEIAPEDSEEILKFIEIIKKVQVCKLPTKKPMDMMNIIDYIKIIKNYGGAGKYVAELSKLSIEEYVSRFKSEIIKKAIIETLPKEYSALALFFTLGTFTSGDGGWPKGGSLAMASRMEQEYKGLGGKIEYNSRVKRVIVEDGEAKGIELANGKSVSGDYIISAIDANMLLRNLLGNKISDKVFDTQFNNPAKYPIHSSVDIGIGVKCDLSNRDHSVNVQVEPFKCGSLEVDRIGIKHYCYEEDFSPKGCSTIKINIIGDDYNYWKDLKDNNEQQYYNEKDKLAKEVLKRIELIYPETKGNFEVYDVCTPVTYERYCGAYKGSWMAFDMLPNVKKLNHGGIIKGINNLYVAGQWISTPGGLPTAVVSGKWAIQKVCRREKVKFNFEY
ncbi:NAD(P)/FAD-dependent oxidoreductase [Clostridium sp. YIM B02551]|uniref:phytoene desaturase family protein n=1 Tax=Clostridium sp. YIM B02551 TaxID=2910679 RepID=UPI001EEA36AD|nr:NAD(P)/FAD-dependent oxidoreductase [Clostridium sp. YIM B02551]